MAACLLINYCTTHDACGAVGTWFHKSSLSCKNTCNPGENYYADKPGVPLGCYPCGNALNSIIFVVDTQTAMASKMGDVYNFIETIVNENGQARPEVNQGNSDRYAWASCVRCAAYNG